MHGCAETVRDLATQMQDPAAAAPITAMPRDCSNATDTLVAEAGPAKISDEFIGKTE
jgi:hypothetical protein